MDGMYSVNAGAINGLCGPDGLQKNSIERSVPKAEGAWSVFITMDGWYTENAGRNFWWGTFC